MTNVTQEERLEWREHFGEVSSYNMKCTISCTSLVIYRYMSFGSLLIPTYYVNIHFSLSSQAHLQMGNKKQMGTKMTQTIK